MIKCPDCQNAEYYVGNIKIGNSGSVDVIYCTKCETIIGILGNTLKRPHDRDIISGETIDKLAV